MRRLGKIFLSGLLALLPLVLTLALVGWLAAILASYLGPGSVVGRLLTALGLSVGSAEGAPYLIGVALSVLAIFLLGFFLETRLWGWISAGLDALMLRIPVISTIYSLSKRFVSLVDLDDQDGIKNMSAVWCFFGGEGGAAVLALLPSASPVRLGAMDYVGILVPTAPVPVGGGLIYVPTSWIKAADIGVDELMSIYVSMGATPAQPGAKAKPLASR
jgi:uncharacterized membrane protein